MNPVRPVRRRLATTVAGLLTATLAMVVLPGTAYAGPNEGDIFSAVNSARASAGLPAYSSADDLAAAARGQAERMAASGELYHNPNLASEVGGWSRIGENVAFAGDWQSAHDVLMNSPDHRAQILDSGYTQMGVGTAVSDDGTFWVAEVFRTPSGAPTTSGGGGASDSTTTTSPTTTTPSRPAPTAAPPQPSPEQILRQHIRDARDKVANRAKGRTSNDPITAALDFSTVMDTVSG
ncbi:MAG: CAP domain-containing protein [Actinomycetia bacterium]|nr:CAP domain-containing protein [Actinomycetes bacterium]